MKIVSGKSSASVYLVIRKAARPTTRRKLSGLGSESGMISKKYGAPAMMAQLISLMRIDLIRNAIQYKKNRTRRGRNPRTAMRR
jgi:hypothetical protein